MLHDENKDLPILEAGREERYTVKEAVKLIVEEQDKICSNTPLRVRTNLSFLVHSGHLDVGGILTLVERFPEYSEFA